MMKAMVVALSLAAGLLVVVAVSLAAPAGAQGGLAAPGNVRVVDGANAGEVTVSWDGVDDAAFYRIGWVASDRIAAVQAAGQEWLDAFAFADVANRGQTAHTLTDLAPGVRYAFSIGSIDARFGAARWSEWAYLTLAEASPISCPTDGGESGGTPAPPTPTPSSTLAPTPTPTPAPQPTPVGRGTGDYDYDADQDGLIEVVNLAQLNAIRADLNGDGLAPVPGYAAAFPNAMPGMGCPAVGCTGYELAANLDFDTNGNGEADAGDAYWNDGAGWVPIGNKAYKFTADFDGNNHTIANLYINRSNANYTGLFAYASGIIRQVGLVSATVSGGYCAGGLVGRANSGSISGSYATGSVSNDYYCAGGLVGYSDGSTISDSYATGSVSGRGSYVGGLVGYNSSGAISGSYATGSVASDDRVGGLVGYNYYGTISASYATGSVAGSGNYVGGLVGRGYSGVIIASYATGSVAGGDGVGGLVGYSSYGDIVASYAAGSAAGKGDGTGGLVGWKNGGGITASYAVGRVSTTSGDTFYIGGLVGYDESGDIVASYWDTQTTGQAGSYGGVGKTTAELQSPTSAAGIYASWDPDWWDFGNTRQYPVLKYGGLDVAAQRR